MHSVYRSHCYHIQPQHRRHHEVRILQQVRAAFVGAIHIDHMPGSPPLSMTFRSLLSASSHYSRCLYSFEATQYPGKQARVWWKPHKVLSPAGRPSPCCGPVPGRGLAHPCHNNGEFENDTWLCANARLSQSLPRLLRQVAVCHPRHAPALLGCQLGDHLRPAGCLRPVTPRPSTLAAAPSVAGSPPARTPGCRTSRCPASSAFPS